MNLLILFIFRAKELKSPILCKFSQNLGKSVTQISQSPSFNKAKTVKISEIGEQTMVCFALPNYQNFFADAEFNLI